MSCPFCAIAAGDIESDRIAEDETGVAFLDLHPKSAGHTLVIPRRHVVDLTDGADAFVEIAPLVSRMAQRLQQRLGAAGMNLVVNSGRAAGQEVGHLHVHLVPRYEGADEPDDREAVVALLQDR